MRDRIPGIGGVLPNGAIRYGIYDADGVLLRYEYIKAADNPTQQGTPLGKNTLLRDSTARRIGLDPADDPTVDDALAAVGIYPELTVTIDTGSSVTASHGTTTLTGTSVDGMCVLNLTNYGAWTVTATKDGQTASTPVLVDTVKQYSVTLQYFASTIVVTYPAGSTLTCTKGSTVLTAPTTTGSYTFTVTSAGTWVVASTIGTESASASVVISTSGQSASVTLAYKPTASLTAKSGVTYTNGISGLAAAKMSLYGEAISNNASITNTTSVVYIDDGALHYKISVGDTINLNVSGAAYEFVVMGCNHDELVTATAYGAATATGKAGMTLQMKNCLSTRYKMNTYATNVNGWNGCAFRTTLQGTIKNSMDSAWQSAIKTVKKLTSAGSQSATITTSNDTLFLLSEIEIFGSVTYAKSGEGSQYAWYRADNTKVKSVSGSASYWSERSPRSSGSTDFCLVFDSGNASAGAASGNFGVSFCFCI